MQVVTSDLIQDKKVLLRLDIDVPLRQVQGKLIVAEDFRLQASLPTLKLCLDHAQQVIIMGHIGRPEGEDPDLSVAPIYDWLGSHGLSSHLTSGKLKLLENLRFEGGEDDADLDYAKQLANLGDIFVNEAFAAHHKAASTTILPTLLPDVEDPEGRLRPRRACGLRFAQEVKVLSGVRENPKKPLVVIVGGVKAEDKLPAIEALSKIADYVLVGGKIVEELSPLAENILLGVLNEEGTDLSIESLDHWKEIIEKAGMIVWNGPVGKIEDEKNDATKKLAQIIMNSEAETVVGGGDTVGYLEKLGLLEKFGFVSTGGGAMLEYLIKGNLPTIEALE